MTVSPPIEPMLAKIADEVPRDGDYLFEPKWDGFRAIVFRGKDDVYIQSRDLRPLDRYFSELHAVLRSEEHTSELQSQSNLVCRLLLEKKKKKNETSDCII